MGFFYSGFEIRILSQIYGCFTVSKILKRNMTYHSFDRNDLLVKSCSIFCTWQHILIDICTVVCGSLKWQSCLEVMNVFNIVFQLLLVRNEKGAS